jgi:hypothetical protein
MGEHGSGGGTRLVIVVKMFRGNTRLKFLVGICREKQLKRGRRVWPRFTWEQGGDTRLKMVVTMFHGNMRLKVPAMLCREKRLKRSKEEWPMFVFGEW